jgi:hypothetical protein
MVIVIEFFCANYDVIVATNYNVIPSMDDEYVPNEVFLKSQFLD